MVLFFYFWLSSLNISHQVQDLGVSTSQLAEQLTSKTFGFFFSYKCRLRNGSFSIFVVPAKKCIFIMHLTKMVEPSPYLSCLSEILVFPFLLKTLLKWLFFKRLV